MADYCRAPVDKAGTTGITLGDKTSPPFFLGDSGKRTVDIKIVWVLLISERTPLETLIEI